MKKATQLFKKAGDFKQSELTPENERKTRDNIGRVGATTGALVGGGLVATPTYGIAKLFKKKGGKIALGATAAGAVVGGLGTRSVARDAVTGVYNEERQKLLNKSKK